MQLSIVSTLYQSSPHIDEFIQRMNASAQQITQDYELILVNDGSPDDSLQKALVAQQHNTHLKIVDLSRNFGHHEAGMAGLEQAQGEFVFLIDSDLEEAPELLLEFWQEMQRSEDLDVIYGIQEQRKGGWFEQFSGYLFYIIFNKLSSIKISTNALTVRLMKKQYVDAITQYQERNLFVAGIMAHAGFNQRAWVVTKKSKPSSSYTLAKRLKLFLTCITSFSTQPLAYMFALGNFIFLLSISAVLYFFLESVVLNTSISVLKAILLATGFIVGSLMSCTGLLGLYIAPIATEIKQRPRVIIKTIYSQSDR
ncbi:MAG: glycosyltransferase family 2 protein [Methylococcaceae bacterium]|nr:glycosyltransferase family 2 protein [Methylococcaceae bacterium]